MVECFLCLVYLFEIFNLHFVGHVGLFDRPVSVVDMSCGLVRVEPMPPLAVCQFRFAFFLFIVLELR